jgi:hypothetical protein
MGELVTSEPGAESYFIMKEQNKETVLYGGIALGLMAGAAITTYLWRQRTRALEMLNISPLERAEQIIASCEDKLDSIDRAVSELKAAR